MLKFDKQKSVSIIAGAFLVTSLGLFGCSSNAVAESPKEERRIYPSVEDANLIVLYHNGDSEIIIPVNQYQVSESYVTLCVYTIEGSNDRKYVDYGYSEVTLYHNVEYDDVRRIASSGHSEVYLFRDVVEGHPVNLALGDRIMDEMGVSKNRS